jgi:hypothetical protein
MPANNRLALIATKVGIVTLGLAAVTGLAAYEPQPVHPPAERATRQVPEIMPSAPGRWRLAPWILSNVRLSFDVMDLGPDPFLAIKTEREVHLDAGRFRPDNENNAATISDHVIPRDASTLSASYLDTLQSLQVDQISSAIPARGRFVILRRRALPPEQPLRGRTVEITSNIQGISATDFAELVKNRIVQGTAPERAVAHPPELAVSLSPTWLRSSYSFPVAADLVALLTCSAGSYTRTFGSAQRAYFHLCEAPQALPATRDRFYTSLPSPENVDAARWLERLDSQAIKLSGNAFIESAIAPMSRSRAEAVSMRQAMASVLEQLIASPPAKRGAVLADGIDKFYASQPNRAAQLKQLLLVWMERHIIDGRFNLTISE